METISQAGSIEKALKKANEGEEEYRGREATSASLNSYNSYESDGSYHSEDEEYGGGTGVFNVQDMLHYNNTSTQQMNTNQISPSTTNVILQEKYLDKEFSLPTLGVRPH